MVFGHFGDEATKILCNLWLHFARQDGQDGKTRKRNHATKVNKKQKYGINEALESTIESKVLPFSGFLHPPITLKTTKH